jgi:hypothetical protein
MLKCLRIVLDGEENPTYTITESFQKAFEVETIWWYRWYDKRQELNNIVRDKLINGNFDFVFMQLQEANVIFPETLRGIKIPIFNWTGDVRPDIDFFTPIGNETITLFSNDTDTHKMRALGFRSDYLQTGYDHKHYWNGEVERQSKIVFIGNNYSHDSFQQGKLRFDMVCRLKQEFADNFVVFGNNWQMIGNIRETESKDFERGLYNHYLIAINIPHINCAKYYSDRQLRAMACGAMVISQNYPDFEHEFTIGEHLDVWHDIEDLVKKCRYYLNNRSKALEIGKKASEFVKEKCTWDYRVKELIELINKYNGTSIR